MYCRNCGKQISDNTQYCPECGTFLGTSKVNVTPTNDAALVGFILSFLFPISGLIVSLVGLKKSKIEGRRGFAVAGIAIAAVRFVTICSLLFSALAVEYF